MTHTTLIRTLLGVCLATAFCAAEAPARQHDRQECYRNSTHYDFADSTLIADKEALGKAFEAFADTMLRLPPADAADIMRKSVGRLCAMPYGRDKELMRQRLEATAARVLNDTSSVRHNALFYSMFTKILNLTYYADLAKRDGNEYMERSLMKNMPGSPAADFAFIDRNGRRHTLYKEKPSLTVLFFYDPDCHVCHDIARTLSAEPILADCSTVRVIAIYTDNETERWKAHPTAFPKSWTDGYSPDGEMAEKEPYHLPVIPSIYLIGRDRRVLLRDVSPETLIEVIHQLTNAPKQGNGRHAKE